MVKPSEPLPATEQVGEKIVETERTVAHTYTRRTFK
jgi:hypothetical protein